MKNLRTYVLCAGIVLCSTASFAQANTAPVNQPDLNKPKLFAGLPEKLDLNTDVINGLFSTPVGQPASIGFTNDNRVQFQGNVIAAGASAAQVQNLVIRSTNFNGATFSISRITQNDGTVVYKGRIISFAHGDLFILENRDGRYSLIKKNFYDLVNE